MRPQETEPRPVAWGNGGKHENNARLVEVSFIVKHSHDYFLCTVNITLKYNGAK